MPAIKFLIIAWYSIALCLTCFECSPRSFESPAMCESRNVTDCSFQVARDSKNTCFVYNSTVCEKFSILNWASGPLIKLKFESEASFQTQILPYPGVYNGYQLSVPVSAINITLKTIKNGINGYVINLFGTVNICRIIDFRNSDALIPMFFYDCLHALVEYQMQYFMLTIRALPVNEEIGYNVFVPGARFMESQMLCEWQPLIMVFLGSLAENIVKVTFTKIPSDLHGTFNHHNGSVPAYVVSLIPKTGHNQEMYTIVLSNSALDVLHAEFADVADGNYSISVVPINDLGEQCTQVKETQSFFVGTTAEDKTKIWFFIVLALLCIIIGLGVLFFCRWVLYPNPIQLKPLLLGVYSPDCQPLLNVICAWEEYLQTHCNIRFVRIYGNSGDPDVWIKEKFDEANIVMFFLSEGLFHTLEEKQPPVKELHEGMHHWINQVPTAEAYISSMYAKVKSKKKFCSVCFTYSGKQHLPKCLKHMGDLYVLPKQMNKFLCFIFDRLPKLPFMNIYPQMPGCNLHDSKEGKKLLNTIHLMQEAVKNKRHIAFEEVAEKEIAKSETSNPNQEKHNFNVTIPPYQKPNNDDNAFWRPYIFPEIYHQQKPERVNQICSDSEAEANDNHYLITQEQV